MGQTHKNMFNTLFLKVLVNKSKDFIRKALCDKREAAIQMYGNKRQVNLFGAKENKSWWDWML